MRRSECVWAVTITWEGNLETMVYHDYLVCLLHPSSALLKPRFFLLYTLIWHHSLHLAVFALRFVTVCDVCSTLNEFHAPLAKTQLANLSMENIVGCFNFSRIFFFLFFHWSTIYICSALYSFDGMFLSHQNRNSRFFFFLDLHVIFCLFICEWCCIESIRKK